MFIRFLPIYQERVWGGNQLATYLQRTLPQNNFIGESWDIVDRPEAQSIVASGKWEGKTLREVLKQSSSFVLGPRFQHNRPFPIIVKWLDCKERLSLQVHPPQSAVAELGGEPKTENWYFANTHPDSSILAGLKKGVTCEQFTKAIHEKNLEKLIHRIHAEPGDSILIPSGRIHAIEKGNLILEIQENSDTTYRIYDWDRSGIDGKPRKLHPKESLRSIDFNDYEPSVIKPVEGKELLADCQVFRIRKVALKENDATIDFPKYDQPRIIHVVKGLIKEMGTGEILCLGENVLLPYAEPFSFKALKDSIFLVTENFIGNTK